MIHFETMISVADLGLWWPIILFILFWVFIPTYTFFKHDINILSKLAELHFTVTYFLFMLKKKINLFVFTN